MNFTTKKKGKPKMEVSKKTEPVVAVKKEPVVAVKKEPVVAVKKEPVPTPKKEPALGRSRKTSAIAPAAPRVLWKAFDDAFERFRSDFEDILFPSSWERTLSTIPETRVPKVDLEDREKDYILKAEMPGFKKDDIEIEIKGNSVVITGRVGWKYSEKAQAYICKERACESFYRMVSLPEEINATNVTATLSDGLLEVTLPKKAPKQKRKVSVK